MKNSQNNLLLATGALLLGTFIGSLGVYVSKIILRELPPLTVLCLRLTIMTSLFVPLLASQIRFLLTHAWQLVVLSFFLAGNLIFFIIGIGSATALASGLLYASVPITVLLLDSIINHEKLTKAKYTSVVLGFSGALIILYSSHGSQGLGTFQGTALLFLATISYALYLIYSKHLSFHISPIQLAGATSIMSLAITFVVMLIFEGTAPLVHLPKLSFVGWMSLVYLGIFLGVIMYFFIQWGVHHGSALLAASMQYVGMVLTGLSGIWLLNERLTPPFVVGALLIVVGLYFITIHPALRTRGRG